MQFVKSWKQLRDRLGWGLVPLFVFAWVAFVNLRWQMLDASLPFWDPAFHLQSAAEFLRAPGDYLLQIDQRFPPLAHIWLGAILAGTDFDIEASVALYSLSWLALLLGATYLLGRDLVSARAGALATLFLACYPEVFVRSRFTMLDLPLAAMITICAWALHRSEGFERRGFSLGFGLLLGLAQLTKHLALPIVAFPVALVLWRVRWSRRVAKNLALAAAASCVALPWWLPRLAYYAGPYVELNMKAAQDIPHGVFTVAGLAFYSLGLWYVSSFTFALLWWLTLPLLNRVPARAFLLALWGGAFIVLTLVPTKILRYFSPLLPVVALMTASGLDASRVCRFAAPALGAIGLLQMWAMSFGIAWLPEGRMVHTPALALNDPIQVFTQRTHLEQGHWPDPSGWGFATRLAELAPRRTAVVDPRPQTDDVSAVQFLADAARVARLSAAARGTAQTVGTLNCHDRRQFQTFEILLVPLGERGTGFESSPSRDACLRDLTRVAFLPLTQPWTVTAVEVYSTERVRAAVSAQQTLLAPPQVPVEGARVVLEKMEVRHSPDGIQWVSLTLRNTTGVSQRALAGYVISRPGKEDPWSDTLFSARARERLIPPGGSVVIDWDGPVPALRKESRLLAFVHDYERRPGGAWQHADYRDLTLPVATTAALGVR